MFMHQRPRVNVRICRDERYMAAVAAAGGARVARVRGCAL